MWLTSAPFSPRHDRTTTHPASIASAAIMAVPHRSLPGRPLMWRVASSGEAEQTLQISPENGFLLLLGEALHREDPRDRPVERHVVGPVRAEHHAVGADGVDQKARGGLGVDDA